MYIYEIIRSKDHYVVREDLVAISGPHVIMAQYGDYFQRLHREHFEILHLNTKNKVLARENISIGGLDSAIIHPREVFKSAIAKSSARLILLHNHPSGDPKPSRADISITRKLVDAGQLLGIPVIEHVIIGDDYYSMLEDMPYIFKEDQS